MFLAQHAMEPVSRDSVIQKCANAICKFIELRGLRPGEMLPPETALSDMLRVSRNSVREAIRMLHALGFIEKRAGRGVFVGTPLGSSKPHSIRESEVLVALPAAIEVREIIETKCAELAVRVATDEDLERMRESLSTFEAAQKAGDPFSAVQAHLAFHDALVMSARNNLLHSMYQQVRFMIADIGAIGADDLLLGKEHFAGHWAIYTVIRERNPKRVRQAIKSHNDIAGPLRQLVINHAVTKR